MWKLCEIRISVSIKVWLEHTAMSPVTCCLWSFHAADAALSHCDRDWMAQTLKYWISGYLQRKSEDPWYKALFFLETIIFYIGKKVSLLLISLCFGPFWNNRPCHCCAKEAFGSFLTHLLALCHHRVTVHSKTQWLEIAMLYCGSCARRYTSV